MPATTMLSSRTANTSAIGTPSRAAQDDGSLRSAILAAFPAHLVPRDGPVVASLVSLLRVYSAHLSAEDLYYKTEAVLVSDRASHVTPEIVEQVRQTIAQDWEREVSAKMASTSASASAHSSTPARGSAAFSTPGPKSAVHQSRGALGSFLGISPSDASTPASTRKPFPRPSSHHTPAGAGSPAPLRRLGTDASSIQPDESAGRTSIVETLNPHIPSVDAARIDAIMDLDNGAVRASSSKHSRVALAIGTDPRTWNYRYMFERPGTKGHALDEQIEEATQVVLQAYGIADEDLADPAMPSQESVYAVGRIAPTVTTDEKAGAGHAKLNEGLVVETSRRIGSASRTPVQLAKHLQVRTLKDAAGNNVAHSCSAGGQFALYPGLIAGFRGRNGGGEAFIIEEIFMLPPLTLPASPVGDLLNYQHGQNRLDGEPLQVMIACGPFTSDKDLQFRPWHRLMDHVEQALPDVLLLLGPFLPANNAALMDPDLEAMPQELFERHISARLNRLCDKTTRTTAILLPSTRDIVSPHAAWPQPMLDKTQLGLHKRVKCLPNPCLFSINEVIIGASTADVLRDVRAEELVVELPGGQQAHAGERDAMARSVRHLLHQRHFYPLYPASMQSEVPLDVSHAKLGAFTGVSPDVLLLPSVLTPFAKVVDGSVVVNPGQAARGAGGASADTGTFVKLQVQPMPKEKLMAAQTNDASGEEEGEQVRMQHGLYDRTRVDVVRL